MSAAWFGLGRLLECVRAYQANIAFFLHLLFARMVPTNQGSDGWGFCLRIQNPSPESGEGFKYYHRDCAAAKR